MKMTKQRLDIEMTSRGLTPTRSQAESWIKMGKVSVGGRVINKPGVFVASSADIKLTAQNQYVSRAGLKLESVARILKLDFQDKVVLDVGSSTGGFTDYALRNGAKKVYAVDVGTDQLHPSLRRDKRIELHEKTDIRDFKMNEYPDIIVIDVSFISLRMIMPAIITFCGPDTIVAAMVKPQFEGQPSDLNNGVIKNSAIRRDILQNLELTFKEKFVIVDKADSEVSGAKGNSERFYKLQLSKR